MGGTCNTQEKIRNVQNIIRKYLRKRLLKRSKLRWEDNINIYIREK